jgi:hypothetical protein
MRLLLGQHQQQVADRIRELWVEAIEKVAIEPVVDRQLVYPVDRIQPRNSRSTTKPT